MGSESDAVIPVSFAVQEEHRYAAPWACIEWQDGDVCRSAALHARCLRECPAGITPIACSRFRDRERDPGFEMFPDDIPGTHYVMGWCGQGEALGGALLLLSPQLTDAQAAGRAVRAMNHLATSPLNAGGFLQKYTAETGQ